MNLAQILNIIIPLIVAGTSAAVAKYGISSTDWSAFLFKAAGILASVLLSLYAHYIHAPVDAAGNKQTVLAKLARPFTPPKTLILLALLLPVLLLTGCVAYKSTSNAGYVTTVQNRFFGMQVTTTSSSSGTPSVLLGAGSSLVTIYPTSTNALYCAPFFSTASGNATANPFDVSINETIGAGNVASAISSNGTASSTIVPKLSKPVPPAPPAAVPELPEGD